jgi:hypothetical protein
MARHDGSLVAQIERDALDDSVSVATALRKCVALGGESRSEPLRDWATRELQGYSNDEDVPDYRKIGAPLLVDAIVGNMQVTHQQFPPSGLPDVVRENVSEQLDLRQGAGAIEAFARQRDEIKLQPPKAGDLVRLMNMERDDPTQSIISLYWGVSPVAIDGVLDGIRTALVQLVAELRASMPGDAEVPSAEAANQAVSVVATGKRARVIVTAAQASGAGAAATISRDSEHGFWTRWRKVGAFVVDCGRSGRARRDRQLSALRRA